MTRRISKVAARSGTSPSGRSVKRPHTIAETAEILNVSTRTVRRLIDSGALRADRVRPRLPRISDEAIRELLAANSSE
jgi:excisionase family DNA binding protein